jgi:hypothetical protein
MEILMKKLLLAILMAMSFPAFSSNNPMVVDIPVSCVNLVTLSIILEEFEEKPAMTMQSSRDIDGATNNFATVLFINYKTKTWTIAEKITKDIFCITSVGENIEPYFEK